MQDEIPQRKSDRLLSALDIFPLTKYCFKSFIQWACINVSGNIRDYDLIDAIEKNDIEGLQRIEELLVKSKNILGLTDNEFCKSFGFSDDLLTEDTEKVHDILAEPIFVIDLNDYGFVEIKKLPRIISNSSNRQNCDFTAMRQNLKFAIELKTIRMENKPKPEPGKLLGNSMKPYWWGKMFRNNSITKIEDKNQRVLRQLDNAYNHYKCDKKMLAFHTRRLGTSTLMTKENYVEELKLLKDKYPEIDYFLCKDYFKAISFFPELDGT